MSDVKDGALKTDSEEPPDTGPIRQRATGLDRTAPPTLPRRGYSHSPSFAPKDDLRRQIAELTAQREADSAARTSERQVAQER